MANNTVQEVADRIASLKGLYEAREAIENKIRQIEGSVTGLTSVTVPVPASVPQLEGVTAVQIGVPQVAAPPVRRRRKLSVEARRKISEAQKQRWERQAKTTKK